MKLLISIIFISFCDCQIFQKNNEIGSKRDGDETKSLSELKEEAEAAEEVVDLTVPTEITGTGPNIGPNGEIIVEVPTFAPIPVEQQDLIAEAIYGIMGNGNVGDIQDVMGVNGQALNDTINTSDLDADDRAAITKILGLDSLGNSTKLSPELLGMAHLNEFLGQNTDDGTEFLYERFSQCYSKGCFIQRIGDGYCDIPCMTEPCFWDAGDCTLNKCAQNCPPNAVGNGFCEKGCNVAECDYDYGDCEQYERCRKTCLPYWRGDGRCDKGCNYAECGWDDGDCILPEKCSLFCPRHFIGDGGCDPSCDVEECGWDGGDCGHCQRLGMSCEKSVECCVSMICVGEDPEEEFEYESFISRGAERGAREVARGLQERESIFNREGGGLFQNKDESTVTGKKCFFNTGCQAAYEPCMTDKMCCEGTLCEFDWERGQSFCRLPALPDGSRCWFDWECLGDCNIDVSDLTFKTSDEIEQGMCEGGSQRIDDVIKNDNLLASVNENVNANVNANVNENIDESSSFISKNYFIFFLILFFSLE
eukprot:GHVL01025720.1.p1 GENE.GHVL01025720.1~~GHVL01025720.1.p1  ORF type:complete len:535 (-),score=112.32 GHVL01025720.1:180-1784(-)